jgi:hypothetical protein
MPPTGILAYPMPIARMADALLETLMVETKRLIIEKAYAVHAVAAALIEHGELIGSELEEVFLQADAANPDDAGPFERKLFTLPRLFDEKAGVVDGGQTWPAVNEETAAASMRPWVGSSGTAAPMPESRSTRPIESAGSDGSGSARPQTVWPAPVEPGSGRPLPPMPPPVWPAPAGQRPELYTPAGPIDPADPHAPPPVPFD